MLVQTMTTKWIIIHVTNVTIAGILTVLKNVPVRGLMMRSAGKVVGNAGILKIATTMTLTIGKRLMIVGKQLILVLMHAHHGPNQVIDAMSAGGLVKTQVKASRTDFIFFLKNLI